MSGNVTIRGGPELIQALRGFGKKARSSVRKVMAKKSTDMKNSVSATAPVKSGALKRSFTKYTARSSEGNVRVIVGVGSGPDKKFPKKIPMLYADKVEAKRGFAKKAFDEHADRIAKDIMTDIQRIIP